MKEDKFIEGKIYLLTNTTNGKLYVGQTTRDFEKRMYEHANCYKYPNPANKHLASAIKNDTWEAFSKEIIFETTSLNELNEKEEYYVLFYNSRNPDFGYNKKAGGENHTATDEQKQAQSDRSKGENAYWYNKERDEETIEKIRQTKKDQGISNSVICYDINTLQEIKRYDSIEQACRETGTTRPTIVNHCKNKPSIIFGKFVWRYENEGLEEGFKVGKVERTVEMREKYKQGKIDKGIAKAVICYDKKTNLEVARFNTIEDAIKGGYGTRQTIVDHCDLKYVGKKLLGLYYWRYLNNEADKPKD